MITVRRAIADDAPWMHAQLQSHAQFFDAEHSFAPSEDQVRQYMESEICFIAVNEENERLGLIAGMLRSQPWNPSIVVFSELSWWVPPQHRGSSAGARLLKAFDEYGREHAHCSVMTLEHNSPVNPQSLIRRGFMPSEHTFAKWYN